MALYEAIQNGYHISCLATFAPAQPNFLAHPLDVIKLQAQALGLPHHVLLITPPFEQSYEAGLSKLRDELGIGCVITGDIAQVDGQPNWIRERCRTIGLEVHKPLWGRDRNTLLRQLLDRKIKACFSCVKTVWLSDEWIGRELNDATIAELHIIREHSGLDLCGEEGEYHTLVTNGPMFRQSIAIDAYSTRVKDSLAFMEIHHAHLNNQIKYQAPSIVAD